MSPCELSWILPLPLLDVPLLILIAPELNWSLIPDFIIASPDVLPEESVSPVLMLIEPLFNVPSPDSTVTVPPFTSELAVLDTAKPWKSETPPD